MYTTLEFIAGVILLFVTISSFSLARPGRCLNSWLLKHGVLESMFPLFIITTGVLAVALFVKAIH